MNQNEISVIGATRLVVGLSTILRVTAQPYEITGYLKILSGGGTLEIIQAAFSGTSTQASVGWGAGYPLGASEVFPFYGPSTFYLAATGATMTAVLALGYTSGATIL